MENKRTEELRRMHASVKAKLMSAIAMLLVATIMMSSTTYAWFVLSTAPEVSGMSTAVGANGSLEIALLNVNPADADTIPAGVGNSMAATKDATVSNVTWGNIVDLSHSSYGLSGIALYPAALNYNSETGKLFNGSSALKFPLYGTDGRVATLSAETYAGPYDGTAFISSTSEYGVRAVGQASEADPLAYAFSTAKTSFTNATNAAKSAAKTALDNLGKDLSDIAIKHATSKDDGDTYTSAQVESIGSAISSLETAAAQLKTGIQYSYQAWYISTNKTNITGDVSAVSLDTIAAANEGFKLYVDELKLLQTNLQTAKNELPAEGSGTDGVYVWEDIGDSFNALIDTDGMTVGGFLISDIRNTLGDAEMGNLTTEQQQMVDALTKTPELNVKSGLFSDVANFVDSYVSEPFDLYVIAVNVTGATMNIQKAESVDQAYCKVVSVALSNLTPPSGQANNIITTTYGYMIDLAFRCNTATDLCLTGVTERVSDDAETMGNGSIFTITNGDVKDLAGLRILFLDTTDWSILGVAALDTEPTVANGNSYALHMYEYTIDTDGCVTLGDQKMTEAETGADGAVIKEAEADDTITKLTEGKAKCITVMVYLDGKDVQSSLDPVTGVLNLQYSSSAPLTPMNYSGYVDAVETEATTDSSDPSTESSEPDETT